MVTPHDGLRRVLARHRRHRWRDAHAASDMGGDIAGRAIGRLQARGRLFTSYER